MGRLMQLNLGKLALIAAGAFVLCLTIVPVRAHAKEAVIAIAGVSIDQAHCIHAPPSEVQFSCHRFGRGEGFAVALRKYMPSMSVDGGAFEKLTLLFAAKPSEGDVFQLPNERVFVFYSSGPSAFPGKHGCYGVPISGNVRVSKFSRQTVIVDIDANFDLSSPMGWNDQCQHHLLKKQLRAHFISRDQLNPWYGMKSAAISAWDEARP